MSAICFLIAVLIFGAIAAFGAHPTNGLYWGLGFVALGLFAWVIDLPGWSYRRRN